MLWDEDIYDEHAGELTVRRYLQEAEDGFGGLDSVVLWHAYPRLGFDDRNQFDFYRQLPGGPDGLRRTVDACHTGACVPCSPTTRGTPGRGVSRWVRSRPWSAW